MKDLKLTPKQEKFCQKYIELGNASEAYRLSYDAQNMSATTVNTKASELLKNGKITVRLSQIQEEHKQRHNITVDMILDELEEARKAALSAETPQCSAAITATMNKAKLVGLDKPTEDGVEEATPVQVVVQVQDARKYEPKAECTTSGVSSTTAQV